MNILRNIIDFIYPLMPKGKRESDANSISIESIVGDETILHEKEKAARQYYQEEKDRVKSIEGKASMFITSSGFLGTVLIGTSNILIGQNDEPVFYKLMFALCLLFFVVYMVSTVIFSIEALKRATYTRPDPTTLITIEKSEQYEKNLVADLLNSTLRNQNIANQKMDNVVMAQRYFRRLMLSVLAFVIVILIHVLNQKRISLLNWFNDINEVVKTWSVELWIVILMFILIVASITLSIVTLVKISKKK